MCKRRHAVRTGQSAHGLIYHFMLYSRKWDIPSSNMAKYLVKRLNIIPNVKYVIVFKTFVL